MTARYKSHLSTATIATLTPLQFYLPNLQLHPIQTPASPRAGQAMTSISVILALLLSCFMATVSPALAGKGAGCNSCEEFEKQPVITYYIHDTLLQATGNTAFIIASPSGNLSRVETGTLHAINDPMTEGPSATSRRLGDAQGLYLTSVFVAEAPSKSHIHQQFTAVFAAKYNGSIAYQGDDGPLDVPVREIAVVGGTGQFRRASGYCLISTDHRTSEFSFVLKVQTHLWLPKARKC